MIVPIKAHLKVFKQRNRSYKKLIVYLRKQQLSTDVYDKYINKYDQRMNDIESATKLQNLPLVRSHVSEIDHILRWLTIKLTTPVVKYEDTLNKRTRDKLQNLRTECKIQLATLQNKVAM